MPIATHVDKFFGAWLIVAGREIRDQNQKINIRSSNSDSSNTTSQSDVFATWFVNFVVVFETGNSKSYDTATASVREARVSIVVKRYDVIAIGDVWHAIIDMFAHSLSTSEQNDIEFAKFSKYVLQSILVTG